MKNLLVNLPTHNTPFPIGLSYIAGSMKSDVRGIDLAWFFNEMEAEQGRTKSLEHVWSLLKNEVLSYDPDTIGLTLYQFSKVDEKFVNDLREITDAFLIAGGSSCTLPFYRDRIMRLAPFDFIVVGEGELTIKEIEDKLAKGKNNFSDIKGIFYRKNGSFVQTPLRKAVDDLDDFFPDRSIFPGIDLGPETYPKHSIYTSRGCNGKCDFCSSHTDEGLMGQNLYKKRRIQSPKRVRKELEEISKLSEITSAFILDDDFFGDSKENFIRVDSILEDIIEIGHFNEVDFQTTSLGFVQSHKFMNSIYEKLEEMKARGIDVNMSFGAESMDPELLAKMHKRTNPKMNLEAARICKKYGGSKSHFNYIMFPRYDMVFDQLKNNIDGFYDLLDILPAHPIGHTSFLSKFVVPIPASPIWYELKEQNKLIEVNIVDETFGSNIFHTSTFSDNKVAAAYCLIEIYKSKIEKEYSLGDCVRGRLKDIIETSEKISPWIPKNKITPLGFNLMSDYFELIRQIPEVKNLETKWFG